MTVELVLIFSVALSFVISLAYRLLIKPDEMRKVKEESKFFNQKVKEAQKKGNEAEVKKYSSEMLKMSQKQMKLTMKPMIASMVIFFLVLGWFGSTFADVVVMLPFGVPFFGMELNWFWWYVVITLPTTIMFRKALGAE